jgi:hypothetical protein
VKQDIKETWDLLINPRMLKVLPLIISSAMSIAIYAAVFIPLMVNTIKVTPDTQDWNE